MSEIRDTGNHPRQTDTDADTLPGANPSDADLSEADLSTRALQATDLPALVTLTAACLEVDGGLPHAASEGFVATRYPMDDPGCTWGTFVNGRLVASAGVQLAPAGLDYGASVVGQVHPAYRRWNLGGTALLWSERNARELLDVAPDRPRVLRLTTESFTEAAGRLYARHRWTQTLLEEIMRRDLREPLPDLALPAAVSLRPWSDALAPAFFRVYTASFQERPGFPGWDAPTWIAWATGDDDFLPEASLLAVADGAPVGFIVCAEGWIVQVGVLPEWRGRGIGAALVLVALRRMRASGAGQAYLDVNSNNPHAAHLYRRLGFQVIGRRARYVREVRD